MSGKVWSWWRSGQEIVLAQVKLVMVFSVETKSMDDTHTDNILTHTINTYTNTMDHVFTNIQNTRTDKRSHRAYIHTHLHTNMNTHAPTFCHNC